MKTALVVPAAPSVLVWSEIETLGAGSSSVIVPTPEAVRDRCVGGVGELDAVESRSAHRGCRPGSGR